MSKSRNKRLTITVVVMLPFVLIVGAYLYMVAVGDSDLQIAFAEADLLEPGGWRLTELEAKRAKLPDAENSAVQVVAVKQLLANAWPQWPIPVATKDEQYLREARQDLENSLGDIAPPLQLNEPQINALRAELKRAEPALAKARKLASMPNGRYAIAWSRDYIGTLLPQVQDARGICNLLAYDAVLKAQDGDLDGALTSCRAALNVARSMGDMPTLIGQLVRMACRTVAMRRAERTLAQGQPAEKALATIQRALEEEAEEPLLLYGTRGERAGLDQLMDAIQTGDMKFKNLQGLMGSGVPGNTSSPKDELELLLMVGSSKGQRAAILRHMTQAVEIAKLPAEEQHDKFKEWEMAAKDQPLMVRLLCPAIAKVATACHRTQAELRCAGVAVAVERYRLAIGRWPESLTALVPKYLKKIPTDPFDGKPLRFTKFDQGVVVYSIGIDRVDNGGHIDLQHPQQEGVDLGFRLWDVVHRRQPAQPFKLPELPQLPPELEGPVDK